MCIYGDSVAIAKNWVVHDVPLVKMKRIEPADAKLDRGCVTYPSMYSRYWSMISLTVDIAADIVHLSRKIN